MSNDFVNLFVAGNYRQQNKNLVIDQVRARRYKTEGVIVLNRNAAPKNEHLSGQNSHCLLMKLT